MPIRNLSLTFLPAGFLTASHPPTSAPKVTEKKKNPPDQERKLFLNEKKKNKAQKWVMVYLNICTVGVTLRAWLGSANPVMRAQMFAVLDGMGRSA